MEEYTFANSSSLDFPVHVKIGSLEGYQTPLPRSTLLRRPDLRHVGSNISAHSDLYVTAQLWADSKPLTVPVQTSYKAFKNARTWNQWLQLPLSIATLPLGAQLAITVWDLSPTGGGDDARGHSIPFGGTTVRLYDKDDTLRKGRQRCCLHRHKAADGFSSTSTPAEPPARRGKGQKQPRQASEQERELERLESVFKKHEMGEIPRVDWLDRLVFEEVGRRQQEVERVNKNTRRRRKKTAAEAKDGGEEQSGGDSEDDDERFTLTIEFPRFDFPVVFTDHEYAPTAISTQPQQTPNGSVNLKPPPEVQYGPGIHGGPAGADEAADARAPPLIRVYDPEVGARDNPAESKHRRLVRSHRTGVLDRDLRPNAKIRDELNTIMGYGPTQELNSEEKDLVWKFRHHLTREKRALTKFIKSVNWQDASEVRQAIQILPRWTEIDVDDALELLGPTFDHPSVRAYAVDRLRKADDDELLLYLLQLVQALKFEKRAPPPPPPAPPQPQPAAEGDDAEEEAPAAPTVPAPAAQSASDSSLASFLIARATQSFLLGNYLHWYLMVECDDGGGAGSPHRALFARVSYDFMTALEATAEGAEMRRTLLRQAELITLLTRLAGELQKFGAGQRQKMVAHARQFLADPRNGLARFDAGPLPLPLDPSVQVTGIVAEETGVFKSSLHPMLLHFRTHDGRTYPVLFKKGDDMRQDQLVIQIISLMDRLLRKENLDLKLSPFRVLATSASAGAAQFVPSIALQAAKTKYGGNYVLEYLRANNPDKQAEYGVRRETMENYVKSVAGYCVVTYLLGVGDRHLDNLLLAPDGHFFHIDFGYILGRDPKPAPPPIKITLAMLDGMGGAKSANFALFQQHCFTAYLALRKQSSLILNLFSLMQDADIPDIRVEPDKVVEKVRERFRLEVGEEEAMREFGRLVEDSLSRIVPLIVDGIHEWVQRYRG